MMLNNAKVFTYISILTFIYCFIFYILPFHADDLLVVNSLYPSEARIGFNKILFNPSLETGTYSSGNFIIVSLLTKYFNIDFLTTQLILRLQNVIPIVISVFLLLKISNLNQSSSILLLTSFFLTPYFLFAVGYSSPYSLNILIASISLYYIHEDNKSNKNKSNLIFGLLIISQILSYQFIFIAFSFFIIGIFLKKIKYIFIFISSALLMIWKFPGISNLERTKNYSVGNNNEYIFDFFQLKNFSNAILDIFIFLGPCLALIFIFYFYQNFFYLRFKLYAYIKLIDLKLLLCLILFSSFIAAYLFGKITLAPSRHLVIIVPFLLYSSMYVYKLLDKKFIKILNCFILLFIIINLYQLSSAFSKTNEYLGFNSITKACNEVNRYKDLKIQVPDNSSITELFKYTCNVDMVDYRNIEVKPDIYLTLDINTKYINEISCKIIFNSLNTSYEFPNKFTNYSGGLRLCFLK